MKPVTTVLSLGLDNRHQILLLFNSCCIIKIVVSTLAKMLSRVGIHYNIEEFKEDQLRKVYVPWGSSGLHSPNC